MVNLQIPTGDNAPQATTTGALDFNLPADATPPTAGAFSPADANTYNQSTSMTVYDSLGAAHTASFYFVNSAPNTWSAYEYVDGNPVNATGESRRRHSRRPLRITAPSSDTGALTAATDAAGGQHHRQCGQLRHLYADDRCGPDEHHL